MQQERIWILTARKLSNEATEEEEIELKNLAKKNDNMCYAIEILYGVWNNRTKKESALQPVEKLLKRISICEEDK